MRADLEFEATETTTCGYCGVGCRLETHVHRGRVMSISPALDGPANEGHTCVKGRFAHQFSRSRERLTAPLIREGDGFRLATWEEAIDRIATEFGRIKSEHGPDAIAGLASSRATNEDCYLMQRMMRAAIGTNNIDNCSRVCHSPTSFALRKSFGLSGATGSFTDIDKSDVAVIIGANPTAGPSGGGRTHQAGRAARLPSSSPSTPAGSSWPTMACCTCRPARAPTPPCCWGLMHVISRDGLVDRDFIDQRTEGYEEAEELSPAVQPRGGRGDHRRSCRRPRGGRSAVRRSRERVVHLGPRCDRAQVRLRGRAADLQRGDDDRQGRPSRLGAAAAARPEQRSGILRHGCAPGHLHRPIARSATRTSPSRSSSAWGVELSRDKGYTIPQMFDAAVDGRLKAMYIFGEDVAQTDPDTSMWWPRMEALDFLVVPGDLRERDDQVRRRDPAGIVVPGEGRHVHQRRAPDPAGFAGDRARPARPRPTSTSSSWCRARSAMRSRWRHPPTRWTRWLR